MEFISLYTNKGYLLKLNNEIIKHIKIKIGKVFYEDKLIINLYNQNYLKFPDINKVFKNNFIYLYLKIVLI